MKNNSDYFMDDKNMPDLFETPIRSGKVRSDVWYHQYRNGIINIQGEKFSGYSITDAIRIWRKKHPIKIHNAKNI